jgi:hypothetical protein
LDRFFDLLWQSNAIPSDYVAYGLVNQIKQQDWPFMASEIVQGQLREVLNGINQFQTQVNRLDAWAKLLEEFPEREDRDFIISQATTVGFFCICQPYALKERIVHAATQVIHQGNRKIDKSYIDMLLTDAKDLTKPKWSTKLEKHKALCAVGKDRWVSFPNFEESLKLLNTKDFECETLHFRTGANHLISPNFEFGEGPFVTRYMSPHSSVNVSGDGSFAYVENSKTPYVTYGFGGASALKLADVVTSCSKQHAHAKATGLALMQVVEEIIAKIAIKSA